MPCPHFRISIRQRSKRQSAVAGAAYQAGESLFSEYDQRTKNYRYKAPEVVCAEIIEYSAGVVHVNREAWCMLSGEMVQSDRSHGADRTN